MEIAHLSAWPLQVSPLQEDDHGWHVCLCLHGAVPDLLQVVLRFVTGTQRGAEDTGAYWQRSVCLVVTHRGCTLRKTVVCGDFSIFWFHWGREGGSVGVRVTGAVPSCRGLLGGPRPGQSQVVHLLPWDAGQGRHRLSFIPRLVLPICKIDV